MKQIIIFPKGQLSSKAKKLLLDAECVPIETDDPSQVKLLTPEMSLIQSNDLVVSMLEAITTSGIDSTAMKTLKNLLADIGKKS